MVLILGADPGLAHFGWAIVALGEQPKDDVVLDIGCFITTKSNKKRRVLASDDTFSRARALSEFMAARFADVRVVAAEAMSYPRQSASAAKLSMSWGALAYHAARHRLAVVQASPQEIKKAICGRKDASKEDVQNALLPTAGRILWSAEARQAIARLPKSVLEHPYDALAAVVTAANSDIVTACRR